MTVTTEFADITDIGTQYIVTATSATTMVAVREGIVRVVTDEQAADKTLLRGSLQEYSPERALVAILSTTELKSIASQDGAILIALRDDRE